ncbi:MAG: FAD-dependent oxidoreductase [Pseudomonadota bacterium]
MESLAQDLATMVRTPLHDDHIARMHKLGEIQEFPEGHNVVDFGSPVDSFIYVLEGEVAGYDPLTGGRYGVATLGPGQFLGEIGFLQGGQHLLAMRTLQPTKLLVVDREDMLELMSQIPEMSDIIVTVFSARRRRMIESNQTGLTLWGGDSDRRIRQIAAFAGRNRIPVRELAPDSSAAAQVAQRCGIDVGTPAVILGEASVMQDPSLRTVARTFGLDVDISGDETFDVLIVGGGPSGIAAGVYAGAEGLKALVVEDLTIGGQAGTSSRIENYMGFPTGISGADLCWRGEVQAMKFGTRFAVPRRAAEVRQCSAGLFHVTLDDGDQLSARSMVIATGVQYRRLPIDRLQHFEGAGVYYAATDVEARFCRQAEVAIIGGGNSAGQAAMFLSRSTSHVHLLVRGPNLAASMSDYLLSRLESDPRITLHYRTEMCELHGDDQLSAITIRDKLEGRDWRLNTAAVFVMVGAAPNTGWLSGLVELDAKGFVKTGADVGGGSVYATSCPGVFAVGDVRAGSVKRVASGVGEGSVVISRVWEYLNAFETG